MVQQNPPRFRSPDEDERGPGEDTGEALRNEAEERGDGTETVQGRWNVRDAEAYQTDKEEHRQQVAHLPARTVADEPFVRMRIQDGAYGRRNHELHAGKEEDALTDAEKQDRSRQDLLNDFELQEDVASPEGVQNLQIDRMDGPQREDDAGDLQKRNCRQPNLAQQNADQRLGNRSQEGHQREYREGRQKKRLSDGVPKPRLVVLQLGKRREHHARQTAVDRIHRRLRELPSPIVESEVGRRIDAPDDETVEIDEEGVQ